MEKIILFIIPVILWLYGIISKIFWAEKIVNRELRIISKVGCRNNELLKLSKGSIVVICVILSYNTLYFKWFWFFLISFYIIILLIMFFDKIMDTVVDYYGMLDEPDSELIKRLVKVKKKEILGNMFILSIWILSWI